MLNRHAGPPSALIWVFSEGLPPKAEKPAQGAVDSRRHDGELDL